MSDIQDWYLGYGSRMASYRISQSQEEGNSKATTSNSSVSKNETQLKKSISLSHKYKVLNVI